MKKTPTFCCDDLLIEFSQVDLLVDYKNVDFWISCATILFSPFYWSCMSRYEYRSKRISKTLGSRRLAVILFGMSILSFGLFRDWRYVVAMESQRQWPVLQNDVVVYLGWGLLTLGNVFVWTSYWRLGFIGTFGGDYFGIFLDNKVTAFPYNVVDNPMYVGSTMNFLGAAFLYSSQAGIFLSLLVGLVYFVVSRLEEPFTAMLYKNRAKTVKNGKKSK